MPQSPDPPGLSLSSPHLSSSSFLSVTSFETTFLCRPIAASPLMLFQTFPLPGPLAIHVPSLRPLFLGLSTYTLKHCWQKSLSCPFIPFDNATLFNLWVASSSILCFGWPHFHPPIPLFVSRWPCPCTSLREPNHHECTLTSHLHLYELSWSLLTSISFDRWSMYLFPSKVSLFTWALTTFTSYSQCRIFFLPSGSYPKASPVLKFIPSLLLFFPPKHSLCSLSPFLCLSFTQYTHHLDF